MAKEIEFKFRVSFEGDRHDIFETVRDVEPRISKEGKYTPGPLTSELIGSISDDGDGEDGPTGPSRGGVTVPDGETLAGLIDAARKREVHWYVEAIVTAPGINVYTYCAPKHWSNAGRVDGEIHVDRKAMLGAVVAHVEAAKLELAKAIGAVRGQ